MCSHSASVKNGYVCLPDRFDLLEGHGLLQGRPHIWPDGVFTVVRPRAGRALHLVCGDQGGFLAALPSLPAHMSHCTLWPPHLHSCVCTSFTCKVMSSPLAFTCVHFVFSHRPPHRSACSHPSRHVELYFYCRLLGHSRPGAVPEHACLLLSQGPRLYHGT